MLHWNSNINRHNLYGVKNDASSGYSRNDTGYENFNKTTRSLCFFLKKPMHYYIALIINIINCKVN